MSLRRAGAGLLWLAILSALPAVAQQEPATWRQLYVEAGRSLAQGQYDQALKGYQAALDLTTEDNERAQVLLGLANVYRSRRDVPRQLDCLRQVEALPHASPAYVSTARRRMAALCRDQGDYATARQITEKLLAAARSPEERLSFSLDLAQLDLSQNRAADAVRRLEPLRREVREGRALAELYATLSRALIAAGRAQDAATLVREASKQFPNRLDILLNAAVMLAEAEKLDPAVALLQDALLSDPAQQDVLRALFDICRQADQLKRVTDWLDKQARGPAAALWLSYLARVYEWDGQVRQALDVTERLLKLQPQDAAVLQSGAQLALRANDFARAADWLRQALVAHPGDEGLVTLLGEALLRQGQLQQALAAWRQGLAYDPAQAPSVRRLGSVLMRYELYEAALDVYRQGRQAAGQRDAFALNMGGAYEKLGQPSEAAREYAVALTTRDRAQTASSAVTQLYHLADDDTARSAVTTVLEETRQTGALPPEGLGVLLYARTLRGDDPRRLLAELLPAPDGPNAAEQEFAPVLSRAAGRLAAREQPELALPFYERLLQSAAGDDVAAGMARRVADLQLRAGDWRGALALLQRTLEPARAGSLSPGQRAALALMLGDVLLHYARRPTDAVGAYELTIKAVPESLSARLARWGQADALFALGDYDQALEEYERLLNLPTVQDEGEPFGPPGRRASQSLPQEDYVMFQRAEALLRQEQFAKAAEDFHKLAAMYAAGDYANDALQRVLLLSRLQQDKAGAGAYVQAATAWARGEAEAAAKTLDVLHGEPASPLADAALMLLAEIRVWQGDTGAAVAAYDRLLAQCPGSPLAARAAFTAAMLLCKQDQPAAQARLQALTATFPETAEAEEAQLVLQTWQGK